VLSRREFLKSSALTAVACGSPGLAAFTTEAAAPRNLVFIIADQHSGLALGCNGHPIVRTPRLDALAGQGVLFTHAYTAGTTCVPSRSSIDTGLHVHTHGARSNEVPLREECLTISKILDRHGYKQSDAPGQGLHRRESYLQWLNGMGYTDVVTPIIGSASRAKIIPTPYRYKIGRAGLALDHSQDAFAIRNAVRFLEENQERRFCLWVRLFGSHDPWVVPEPYDTMYRPSDLRLPPYRNGEYDSKPAQQRRTWVETGAAELSDDDIRVILAHYLGMVSYTDMLIGRLLDRLSELQLDSNTTVIYMADHGDIMGCHRIFTKGFAFYEPAMRVPLIIRVSGGMPGGKRIDAVVSGIDLLPTMLELLNLPPERSLQGSSLVPLWQGVTQSVHDQVFAGQGFEGYDRLVMMRTPEWKLTRYDEGGGELYDLRKDPHELANLYEETKYASIRGKLTERMESWDRAWPHAPLQLPLQQDARKSAAIKSAFDAWMQGTKKPGRQI
jgi:choline-sulfatase